MSTRVDVDGSWSIAGKPHGGYLLRMMAAEAVDADHPHPMAVSAHYVTSADPGPAVVEAERLRTGRRVATTRTRLVQDQLRVEALVTTGRYGAPPEPLFADSRPPAMPPLADCPRSPVEPFEGFRVGHLEHVAVHLDPACVAPDRADRRAEVRAWVALDSGDASALDLLVLADALPPVTVALGLPGWVPTVELTVLVRGVPAPGPLVAVQRARLIQDGWLDEECDLWDSTGRLVCQARQLAGYRA